MIYEIDHIKWTVASLDFMSAVEYMIWNQSFKKTNNNHKNKHVHKYYTNRRLLNGKLASSFALDVVSSSHHALQFNAYLQTSFKSAIVSIGKSISATISVSRTSFLFLSYEAGSRNSKNCRLKSLTDIRDEVHSPRVAILDTTLSLTNAMIGQNQLIIRIANQKCRSKLFFG